LTYSANDITFVLMKKIIVILLSLAAMLSPRLLIAQTTGQNRRIEEEKRQTLIGTLKNTSQGQTESLTPSKDLDMEYFKQLFLSRVALRYDACKTIIMLLGLEKQYGDIDSQVSFLVKNHIIPDELAEGFDLSEPLRKGEAAYMFCKALNLRGGLWIRLFGLSRRYALKELSFEGIMLPGAANEIVSGKELIFMLTQSAQYITEVMDKKSG